MAGAMETFIDKALRGDATLSQVYDYVETWHESDCPLSLRQFLGMTAAEYERWLTHPQSLNDVVAARRMERGPQGPLSSFG